MTHPTRLQHLNAQEFPALDQLRTNCKPGDGSLITRVYEESQRLYLALDKAGLLHSAFNKNAPANLKSQPVAQPAPATSAGEDLL
jgi:hypothetical protein